MTLQEAVRVIIVDGHHRYKYIVELRNDNQPMFEWYKNPILVYLKLRSDGCALSKIEIVKNRKLLNTSSTLLPCTKFLPIIRYVVAYARKSNKRYSVHVQEASVVEIRKDL